MNYICAFHFLLKYLDILRVYGHFNIYNFGSILLSNMANERLINPKTEFAFLMAADEWLWNINL